MASGTLFNTAEGNRIAYDSGLLIVWMIKKERGELAVW